MSVFFTAVIQNDQPALFVGGIDNPFYLRKGDRTTITAPGIDGPFVYDIMVRQDVEVGFPITMDKVHKWLTDKGLSPTADDALELLRIWNGWDGDRPDVGVVRSPEVGEEDAVDDHGEGVTIRSKRP